MHKNAAPRKLDRHERRTLTACLALLSIVVPPLGTALAAGPAPKKRVLLVHVQKAAEVPSIVASRAGGYLDTLMSLDGKIELVSAAALAPIEALTKPGDLGGKVDDALAGGTIKRADEAAEQAKKQAARKKWGEAVKTWTKALTLYEKDLAQLDDHDRYVTALIGRALAYFASGYDDNGEEELARALGMSPETQLPADAPKNMLAVDKRVRGRLAPAGVQLKVVANAPRATVYVDGKNRGSTPVMIGDLTRGDHVVRIVADGFEPHGELVAMIDVGVELQVALTAKPGTVAPVTPSGPAQPETGLEVFARTGDFGPAFQEAVKKLAKANRLDAVALTYIKKDKANFLMGMFVWDATKDRIGAVDPAEVSSDLGGLQVAVLDLVERASVMIASMPNDKLLVGRSPMYDAPPVVAVAPKVEPKVDPMVGPKVEPKKVEPKVEPKKVEPKKVEPKKLDPLVLDPIEANVTNPPKKWDDPPPPDDDEFYQTWWFWTLVGGLAIGSGAAIALSQDGGSSGPAGFRTTVTW